MRHPKVSLVARGQALQAGSQLEHVGSFFHSPLRRVLRFCLVREVGSRHIAQEYLYSPLTHLTYIADYMDCSDGWVLCVVEQHVYKTRQGTQGRMKHLNVFHMHSKLAALIFFPRWP